MRSILQSSSSSNSAFQFRIIWMHLRKKFSIQHFPHITNPSQLYWNANITAAEFKQVKKEKQSTQATLVVAQWLSSSD